jgi:hypothetical protein
MRNAIVPVVMLCALAAGCGTSEPNRLLTGKWGGVGVALDARAPQAPMLDFYCMQGAFEGPVALDPSGHFEAMAWITFRSGPPYRHDDGWLVVGEVHGDEMELRLTYVSPGHTWPPGDVLVLRRGAQPDFSGFMCLASS